MWTYTTMCVRILLLYVSSYYYVSAYLVLIYTATAEVVCDATVCVRIPLLCVCILLLYVSSYYYVSTYNCRSCVQCYCMCPNTATICVSSYYFYVYVLILLLDVCPHTTTMCVSSYYYYTCVHILVLCVSSYYCYMCVLMLLLYAETDEIVCGDDAANVPKPAPDNVLNICNKLAGPSPPPLSPRPFPS